LGNKRAAAVGVAVAAMAAVGATTIVPAAAKPGGGQPKVTICHRTNAETNPYVRITVSVKAAQAHGHQGHTGPVYAPGMKASKTKWGDIIPPKDDAGGPMQSMNWGAGASIWNNGCRAPQPAPTTAAPTTTAPPPPPGPGDDGGRDTDGGIPGEDTAVENESVDRSTTGDRTEVLSEQSNRIAPAAPADAAPGSPALTG
jgi:hypothetical protein